LASLYSTPADSYLWVKISRSGEGRGEDPGY
jgi:hypothetical protein